MLKHLLLHNYRSHDGYKEESNGLLVPTNDKYADQKRVFNDLGMGVLDNAWNGKSNSCNQFILFPFSSKLKSMLKFISLFLHRGSLFLSPVFFPIISDTLMKDQLLSYQPIPARIKVHSCGIYHRRKPKRLWDELISLHCDCFFDHRTLNFKD